jgi:hypothetical protein
MATPGELVKTTATALGIPEGTVFQFDRQLSEAGLRSKGGRGRSAAKVTPEDAANLLIAIVGSPVSGSLIKESAQTCRTYGALPYKSNPSLQQNFAKMGLPTMAALGSTHTLGVALSELIRAATRGEQFCVREGGEIIALDRLLAVRLQGPTPWAEIIGDASPDRRTARGMVRLVYHNIKLGRSAKTGHSRDTSDLVQERWVTFRTVRALAALFPKQEEDRA